MDMPPPDALSTFLLQFVHTFLHDTARVDMTTSFLVLDSLDKKLNLEAFDAKVKDSRLERFMTGIMMSDFPPSRASAFDPLVEKHGGVHRVILGRDGANDEDNELYACFHTPRQAYAFMLEMKSSNLRLRSV